METILIISSVVLWITVIFNLLLTFAIIRKVNAAPQYNGMPLSDISDISEPYMLEEGTKAPQFTVNTLDGREVTQEDYAGKKLAMVFVSSTCGPCREKMPELQELYPKAQKAGVELMILNLEDIDATRAYVDKLQFNAPILSAPWDTNPLNGNYKIPGTPSYYIIDHNGKIKSGGFLDADWIKITQMWS